VLFRVRRDIVVGKTTLVRVVALGAKRGSVYRWEMNTFSFLTFLRS
jgi:hypothetical protein